MAWGSSSRPMPDVPTPELSGTPWRRRPRLSLGLDNGSYHNGPGRDLTICQLSTAVCTYVPLPARKYPVMPDQRVDRCVARRSFGPTKLRSSRLALDALARPYLGTFLRGAVLSGHLPSTSTRIMDDDAV